MRRSTGPIHWLSLRLIASSCRSARSRAIWRWPMASNAVVIAGGLGYRLKGRLAASGFAGRFVAKGRFRERMEAIPVKLLDHPQPGLYGAAAAFAKEHP